MNVLKYGFAPRIYAIMKTQKNQKIHAQLYKLHFHFCACFYQLLWQTEGYFFPLVKLEKIISYYEMMSYWPKCPQKSFVFNLFLDIHIKLKKSCNFKLVPIMTIFSLIKFCQKKNKTQIENFYFFPHCNALYIVYTYVLMASPSGHFFFLTFPACF